MAKFIKISYFNLNDICKNPTIIINAKRGSGKSTLVRELMNYFNTVLKYPICVLCSYSEKVDPYYSYFLPASYIYEDCEKMLTKVLKRQTEMININNQRQKEGKKKYDDRILVVMDDCISDAKIWKRSKDLAEIFYNGRHYNISLIIVSQDIVAIPPSFRANIDIVMLFNSSIQEELKKLFQHYAGEFTNLQEFKDTLNMVCQDYGAMIILKRGYRSLDLCDKVFRYKADINLKPKIFGCRKFKKLNKKYYNSNWLDEYNKMIYGNGTLKQKTNVKLV